MERRSLRCAARWASRRRRSIAGSQLYGGLLPSKLKKLLQLDEENTRLRKVVADLTLDKEMLQEVIRRKLLRLLGDAR